MLNALLFRRMLVLFLFILLMAAGTAFAHEDESKKDDIATEVHNEAPDKQQIPEQVTSEHWAYKEIEELGGKYAAEKKLPCAAEEKTCTCTKRELAQCLLSILDKIIEKYDKGGAEAIPREDLDRIASLHKSLQAELTQYEGYVTRRETIEIGRAHV
jgi:hypothetical protein